MRILTVAMHVPDSRATIRVAADGLHIDTGGVKFVCNPFDEFAVEQGLQLKESRADVEEVAVLTVGPADAVEALRSALAMGADRGIHVRIDEIVHDEIALAEIAAAAIGRAGVGFDLILCGKQTIDRDAGELGPAMAEFLGLPHVGAVTRLELAEDGKTLTAHRRVEGAEEVVESPLPALLTCEKGLVEPRYPSLPNVMKARSKPTVTLDPADVAGFTVRPAGTSVVGLTPPAATPACRMIDGEPTQMARELVRLLREEAKVV